MAIKRIIPVSSGKGGVGKTTFAVNFSLALSRHGRTVLVDLDTGTSAVRNGIDTPVTRDLYHFFKKGEPLANCITHLDPKLDPRGDYKNFGFVAGPVHLIEDITNFGHQYKSKLIEGINSIDADYVILDLKAGLDSNVIDFLPFSNSGILLFTPHLPAATLAASDIVKAILFRKLRLIFGRSSPFFTRSTDKKRVTWKAVNDLIDVAEDVYDPTIGNLDELEVRLQELVGVDHPIVIAARNAIQYFKVHYVLNLFNGVESSFNTAVKPFMQNLTTNVSSRCVVTNLGWITRSDKIHEANCNRIPALLMREKKRVSEDRYAKILDDLRVTSIGLDRKKDEKKPAAVRKPEDHLNQQLDAMKQMFDYKKEDDYRANFDYMTQRVLFLMKTRRPSDIGDLQIFSPKQMLNLIYGNLESLTEKAQRKGGEL